MRHLESTPSLLCFPFGHGQVTLPTCASAPHSIHGSHSDHPRWNPVQMRTGGREDSQEAGIGQEHTVLCASDPLEIPAQELCWEGAAPLVSMLWAGFSLCLQGRE